jgi:hypothetical protein
MIVGEQTAISELEGPAAYASILRPRPPADVRSRLADLIEREADLRVPYPMSPIALVDWRSAIADSDSIQSLLALLHLAALHEIAQRIADLSEPGEALEKDEKPASIDAIKAFALSIRDFLGLGEPLIGLSEDGNLVAEWFIARDKHIALKFLQDDRVAFALIAPGAGTSGRARLSGTGPLTAALAAIRAYGVERWREDEG